MSRKALAAHVHERAATVGWREREREREREKIYQRKVSRRHKLIWCKRFFQFRFPHKSFGILVEYSFINKV